jgi:GH24 family phage-related lysozyme (muramidase)
MLRPSRSTVAALSVSAVALIGLWQQEGWTERAVIPVKGDVPTVGPGLTKRADGSPVQMGDTIKPIEGAQRSLAHIQKDEAGIKSCLTAPLSQVEYDTAVDFAYQYGAGTFCKSSMASEANAGRYQQSCEAYLKYRFVAGRDCSLPGSGCRGVWTRSQGRYQACMAAQ